MIILSVILLNLFIPLSHTFNLLVPSHFVTCVSELIPASNVRGSYYVDGMPDVALNVKISDKDRNILFNKDNQIKSSISFFMSKYGMATICFDAKGKMNTKIPIKIQLEWDTTKELENIANLGGDKMNVDDTRLLNSKLSVLNNYSQQLASMFINLNEREKEFESLFASSANRIMKFTIFISASMIIVCFVGYFYVRRFLKQKKVI